jgi:hypothetical protein
MSLYSTKSDQLYRFIAGKNILSRNLCRFIKGIHKLGPILSLHRCRKIFVWFFLWLHRWQKFWPTKLNRFIRFFSQKLCICIALNDTFLSIVAHHWIERDHCLYTVHVNWTHQLWWIWAIPWPSGSWCSVESRHGPYRTSTFQPGQPVAQHNINQCCGSGFGSRGAIYCYHRSGSGSLQLIKIQRNFKKSSIICNILSYTMYLTTYFFSVTTKKVQEDPDPAGALIYWPSGSVLQNYGSADPDPKEKFLDPQNWNKCLYFRCNS